MSDVAIIIPTLGRSELLAPLAANIAETTPAGRASVYFVVDPGDEETLGALSVIPYGGIELIVCRTGGTYPEKTNAGVRVSSEEWAVLTNDDVRFADDWLEAALAFDRPEIDVIGTRDLSPATENGDTVTMPIVRRSYIADPGAAWGEPGLALHEGYWHNFSETELWQLARDRGCAAFAAACVIEHCHPAWGKRDEDETDARGQKRNWDRDSALYEERLAAWRSTL